MEELRRIYAWKIVWALAGGSLVAAILFFVAVVGWQTAPARQFELARQNWQEQPIPRYRLIIARPSLQCQQDVEVANERIVHVFEDSCPIELLTMTDLYDRIVMLDGRENFAFFPDGSCSCGSTLNAHVFYDPATGYPQEVAISDRLNIPWSERACWRQVVFSGQLPDCTISFPFSQPRTTDVSLIPLP